jgi:uncharacterized membrane protein YgdD (TMEM256/DUF423 family)
MALTLHFSLLLWLLHCVLASHLNPISPSVFVTSAACLMLEMHTPVLLAVNTIAAAAAAAATCPACVVVLSLAQQLFSNGPCLYALPLPMLNLLKPSHYPCQALFR